MAPSKVVPLALIIEQQRFKGINKSVLSLLPPLYFSFLSFHQVLRLHGQGCAGTPRRRPLSIWFCEPREKRREDGTGCCCGLSVAVRSRPRSAATPGAVCASPWRHRTTTHGDASWSKSTYSSSLLYMPRPGSGFHWRPGGTSVYTGCRRAWTDGGSLDFRVEEYWFLCSRVHGGCHVAWVSLGRSCIHCFFFLLILPHLRC